MLNPSFANVERLLKLNPSHRLLSNDGPETYLRENTNVATFIGEDARYRKLGCARMSGSFSLTGSYSNLDCLLESETIIFEACGVILINTEEAWTVYTPVIFWWAMLNYLRDSSLFLFVKCEATRKLVPLGTIPSVAIEKFSKLALKVQSNKYLNNENAPKRLLQVTGMFPGHWKRYEDSCLWFSPWNQAERRGVVEALLRCNKPERVWDLYAFTCGPSKFGNTNPKERLLNEYFRLLKKKVQNERHSPV